MGQAMYRWLLLVLCCLFSTGCQAVGDAVIDGLFGMVTNTAENALFGSDDDEIDPHILKRKGIERGSKAHRKLEAQEKMHEQWAQDRKDDDRRRCNEERKRFEDLRQFRELNASLQSSIDSNAEPLLPHPLSTLPNP